MRFTIGVCATLCAFTAMAAPQTSAEMPLTLNQTFGLVLENNPQLQTAGFDTKAALARVRQQNQRTPWNLGVSLENFAGSGQLSGVDSLESTINVERVLETGNKPRLRGEAAKLESGLLSFEQDVQRLDILTEAAMRFLMVARAQADEALVLQNLALVQRTQKAVAQRFRVGKAAAAEKSRVNISLARAELALEEVEHRTSASRRQLGLLWGDFQPEFETVAADLLRLENDPDYTSLDRVLETNPSLARFATAERLSDVRLKLAQAAQRSDLDFSAGLRHFKKTDDVGMMLSVSMPLGSQKRARAYEQEAQALVEREPLLKQSRELALRATLFGLHQELLHARHRLEVLQVKVIPAAEKALRDYTRGYSAGRYSFLELTQAQDTLLQAKAEELDAALEHHQNRIQIDRLTGTALTTGVKQ